MSIGERIVSLRKSLNLSQGQLAEALDVSRQAVSKWETDISCPDALHLIKLADVLETDIEYLSTGRRTYGRRPPVVIKTTETVEKVIEKPVIQVVEKIVEIEKPTIEYIEKPVYKKIYRTKYIKNTKEYGLIAIISFVLGLILGAIIT